MKIREVTYSRGATINTGNFNSVRVDVSATVVVEEGEDAETVYQRAKDFVMAKVQAEVAKNGNRT